MNLIGILIIVAGFVFNLDIISIIIISSLVTGIISGMDFYSLTTLLGKAFLNTRYMSIFLMILPVIGLLERYGLKNSATKIMTKFQQATVNNILIFYLIFRTVMSMFGVRLGGHVQFIRPILYPIVESVAKKKKTLSDKEQDQLKSISCAVDNYGNFFGQNVFIANSGVLLIIGTFQELGIYIKNIEISFFSSIIAFFMIIVASFQVYFINYIKDKE